MNELNYSYASQSYQEKFVDCSVLVRASSSMFINRILAKHQFDLEEPIWKKPPPSSLILDHVYGVTTSDKRNSIFYLHFYEDVKEK